MGLTLVPMGLLLLVYAIAAGDIIAALLGVAAAAFGFTLWRVGNKSGWWDNQRP